MNKILTRFIMNLKKTLYNIAYSYMHNVDDADDIVQDVFMKFLNSHEEFKTLNNLKYWLIRVTINTCKTYLKSSWKTKISLNDDVFEKTQINHKDRNEELMEIVTSLPPKYNEVIILYYFDDLRIDEISKVLNVSQSAVKKRLERARKIIKEKETKWKN